MAARITAYLVALIVGATFIAGLLVGAQRDDNGPVDLIVVNGNVYTADGDGTMAEAVAVQGNKILLVGSNREVQRLRRPQTVVVDARGGAVLPGFNDTQAQFLTTGLALQQVNLHDARTLTAIESAIKAWASANPEREWVLGRGWTPEAFGGMAPTRQLLDALVPDRPAMILAADGTTAWVNSAALTRAQISRRTPNPPDGVVVRDSRTGEATGVLKDEATALVASLTPRPTRDDRLAAVRAAIDEAHRRGVTSVQPTEGNPEDLQVYDELRRTRDLEVRVYAALSSSPELTEAELERLDDLRTKFGDDPLFKTGAVKLVADAATPADSLSATVAELDERGWQIIIEALGDDALRVALDAFEFAIGRNEIPDRGRRHRIDNPEPLADEANERFAQLGVVNAMQPRAGAPGTFHDPVVGVYVGVNRAAPDGVPTGGWVPVDRMTLLQAVDAYTRDAAWASFDEHRKGSIERDMLADLVVLTRDIFSLAPARLAEADVAVTIFNGKVVYTRLADSDD